MRFIIAAVALCALAPSAQAKGTEQDRGINCARAATKLEKLTCADPKLMEYDSRIGGAYARALGEWNGAIAAYVRADQKQWRKEFLTIEKPDGEIEPPCEIADTACIRDFLKVRTDDIESGAYRHSGVYLGPGGKKMLVYPGLANRFRLKLFDPADTDHVIQTLNDDTDTAAMWDGPVTMIAKMGDASGLPFAASGKGGDCRLRLATAPLAMTVTQTGKCGGVSYAGSYRRDLTQTTLDYELDLH